MCGVGGGCMPAPPVPADMPPVPICTIVVPPVPPIMPPGAGVPPLPVIMPPLPMPAPPVGLLPKLPPLPVIAALPPLPPVAPVTGEFTVEPGPPFFDPPSSDEHAPAHASALIAHHTRNCCPMIHLRTAHRYSSPNPKN
jgi:hypothetical protein